MSATSLLLQMDGWDGSSDGGAFEDEEDWAQDASSSAQEGLRFIRALRINPPDRTYEVLILWLSLLYVLTFKFVVDIRIKLLTRWI